MELSELELLDLAAEYTADLGDPVLDWKVTPQPGFGWLLGAQRRRGAPHIVVDHIGNLTSFHLLRQSPVDAFANLAVLVAGTPPPPATSPEVLAIATALRSAGMVGWNLRFRRTATGDQYWSRARQQWRPTRLLAWALALDPPRVALA
nr:hypothetical protein [Propionicimonas sp.]